MTDPRASDSDLTAKARIRNAALDLYADRGEERVSMRAVAAAAGVTVGLVQHHFTTKNGLRDAVEQLVIDYYVGAIEKAPLDGTAAEISAHRDKAVHEMLEAHPEVVNYIRRAVLDPHSQGRMLERLVDLTHSETVKLRGSGIASTRRPASTQVIGILVRQFGQLLLQPMITEMWHHLTDDESTADIDGQPIEPPTLSVTVS